MPNFFKSFFSGKSETPESEKQKNDQKNFEIFKYDGLRAQRMGRPDYAIKCFTEALASKRISRRWAISANFTSRWEKPKSPRTSGENGSNGTSCDQHIPHTGQCRYIQEDYKAMEEAAGKAIAIEEGNAVAHFLLGKARKGQDDEIMTIAHLTKAITLKDDFIEARLMRAEALLKMKQYKEINGRHRRRTRPESGRRDRHPAAWQGERSQRTGRRSGNGLQVCNGNKPIQRTSLSLSGNSFISSEETGGSNRPV